MAAITREEEKKVREFQERTKHIPDPHPYRTQRELIEESERQASRAMSDLKAFNRKHR